MKHILQKNVIEQTREGTILKGAAKDFSLALTLDCGQAFRWRRVSEEPEIWQGTAARHTVRLEKRGEDLLLHAIFQMEELTFWVHYLDLEQDYQAIWRILSEDQTMRLAYEQFGGMHILQQDLWETLLTFIISANNNIPRIRGIVERLCEQWGELLPDGSHAFPTPQTLARLKEEELMPLRAGYRVPYLLGTARMAAEGEINLDELAVLPTDEARRMLMRFPGVGPKVADCVLLFGCHRLECLPMDVWMKRVMREFYPQGFPKYALPWAGVAQQTLFHYARTAALFDKK